MQGGPDFGENGAALCFVGLERVSRGPAGASTGVTSQVRGRYRPHYRGKEAPLLPDPSGRGWAGRILGCSVWVG